MAQRTTPAQREAFFRAYRAGEPYPAIAERHTVSPECIRYWCRRLRAGGSSRSRWPRGAPAC